jgi:outer membrane protein OmpA-like peptidoglycan-associated protein
VEYEDLDFEAYEFKTSEAETQRVEGHRTIIIYAPKSGAKPAGNLQIVRNFEAAVKKAGGKVLYFDESVHQESLQLNKDGKEFWIEVQADPSWGQGSYKLVILEKGELKQEISANDLLDALNAAGHVAVYINFDSGKATLKSDAQPVIEQITALLKDNPDLKLSIEGHTDNAGKREDNQRLSESRAKAVVAALTKQGIAAARLSAQGFGPDKPVADNATEEGKAKNRRVELVKK